MLPLENIIRKYNLSFYFYVDDSQLYLSSDSPECLKEINDCIEDNFLQLNNNKTEVIIFSPSRVSPTCNWTPPRQNKSRHTLKIQAWINPVLEKDNVLPLSSTAVFDVN